MARTCDVLIVFTEEEILAVILGKGQGIFTKLKKHKVWELILEDLVSINLTEKDVVYENIIDMYKSSKEFQVKIKLFTEQVMPY